MNPTPTQQPLKLGPIEKRLMRGRKGKRKRKKKLELKPGDRGYSYHAVDLMRRPGDFGLGGVTIPKKTREETKRRAKNPDKLPF